jgi:hypothetical protein
MEYHGQLRGLILFLVFLRFDGLQKKASQVGNAFKQGSIFSHVLMCSVGGAFDTVIMAYYEFKD